MVIYFIGVSCSAQDCISLTTHVTQWRPTKRWEENGAVTSQELGTVRRLLQPSHIWNSLLFVFHLKIQVPFKKRSTDVHDYTALRSLSSMTASLAICLDGAVKLLKGSLNRLESSTTTYGLQRGRPLSAAKC